MAPPPPFAVEQWMDEHETECKYNIAETCCASLSINDLLALSENKSIKASDLLELDAPQTYGAIRGDPTLRENLSRLYSSKVGTALSPENVLITPGAIAANHLVFYALIHPGDHVICHYPTYQQLYSVPESLGAEVSLWKSNPENKWHPDLEDLKSMVKETTKLIVLNNPQNPTGAILPKKLLHELVDFCESKGITILSDEVYRPLFHGITPMDEDFPPSIMSLGYKNTIVTGSMSKAYSLAGIRVGWVASRSPTIVAELARARDYTTISVSHLDQAVAAFALSPDTIHSLLSRNIQLAKANLELLQRFVVKHDEFCSWTKPVAGTTAFIKFERDGKPINAEALCRDVQEKTGVMLLPGDVGFGGEFKGYVRFGYVNRTEIVKEALEELRKYMRKEYDDVPLSE
ncbi:aspartate aminotransferase [Lecanosticta acicola]|uniref:Aspartate aminotransferase n=1 Tax=Lecanosticta acicola TaxID=111012 RepID=A0AAI8Z2U4_9PEZI|nr:aspartate aminotransferase [Lecanosticta acicola]